jgi:hypothetical protein
MTRIELEETQLTQMASLAAVLIPGTSTMPAVGELANYETFLRRAVRACGYETNDLLDAVNAIPQEPTWDSVSTWASEEPARFAIASQLVSSAYYMTPTALKGLGYPVERRQPAKPDDFAEEFMTGILDPILESELRFRKTDT